MAKTKSKPRRPRDEIIKVQRVLEVLEIRLNGAEFHDIQAYSEEKGWGLSERQLWRYVAESDKLMLEELEQDKTKIFRRHVFQRRALYARAIQEGDYRTALAILRDEGELQDIYPTKRTEFTGKGIPVVLQFTEEIVEASHADNPPPPDAGGILPE